MKQLDCDPCMSVVQFSHPSEQFRCIFKRAAQGDLVPTKETVRELLDRLPDDCTLDDVLYHLYVIQEIDWGMVDADAGRTIPHERVVAELRKRWVLGATG